MTAHLTLYMERELRRRFGLDAVSWQLLARIQQTPASRLRDCVGRYAEGSASRITV
jgi:DNA polymerase-3 subunit epsilon